jgi:hypothetical protein
MNARGFLKLRMISDLVLVCAFGFAAPFLLAPLSRSWVLLLTSFVPILLALVFLRDGLRTFEQLRKPDSN